MACGKWWQSISLHWNKGDDNLKKRKFANAAVMLILLSVVGYTFFGSPGLLNNRQSLLKQLDQTNRSAVLIFSKIDLKAERTRPTDNVHSSIPKALGVFLSLLHLH